MTNLQKFKDYIEEMAGRWDGDNPGTLEDQAHICSDILERVGEIEILLKELEELHA